MNGQLKKWGYQSESSNLIQLDNGNMAVYHKLEQMEPSIRSCMFCGSCRGTCTALNEGMNFMKINILLRRGELAEVTPMVKTCLMCGKCTLVCPRKVNIRKLVFNLKIMLHELV